MNIQALAEAIARSSPLPAFGTSEPGEGSLHDPLAWQDLEAFGFQVRLRISSVDFPGP